LKLIIVVMFLFCSSCVRYTPYLSGDCVDRAVRIRQNLISNGYEAELVLGLRGTKQGHCWIRYKDKETGEWKELKNY